MTLLNHTSSAPLNTPLNTLSGQHAHAATSKHAQGASARLGGLPAPHAWAAQPDALWVCWLSAHSDSALAPEVVLLPSREVSLEGVALSEWLGARLAEGDEALSSADPTALAATAAAWCASNVASGVLCGGQYVEPCLPGDRPLAALHERAREAIGARANAKHSLSRALFLRVVRLTCPLSLSTTLAEVLMSDATLHVSARTPVAQRAARALIDALLGAPARGVTWGEHRRQEGAERGGEGADVLWRVDAPSLGASCVYDLSRGEALWEGGAEAAGWGSWRAVWTPSFASETLNAALPAPREAPDALSLSGSPIDSIAPLRDSLYMMNYEDAPSEHGRDLARSYTPLSDEAESALAELSLTTTGESLHAGLFEPVAEQSFLPSGAHPDGLPTLDAELPYTESAEVLSAEVLSAQVLSADVLSPEVGGETIGDFEGARADVDVGEAEEALISQPTPSGLPQDPTPHPTRRLAPQLSSAPALYPSSHQSTMGFEHEEHSAIIELSFNEMSGAPPDRDEHPDLDPRLEEQLKRRPHIMIPSFDLSVEELKTGSEFPSESSVMMGRPLSSSLDERIQTSAREDQDGPMTFNEYRHSRDTVSVFVPTEEEDLNDELNEVNAPTRLDLDVLSIERALSLGGSLDEDAPTSAELSRSEASLTSDPTKVDPNSFLDSPHLRAQLPAEELQLRSEAPTLARTQGAPSSPTPHQPPRPASSAYGARQPETVIRTSEAPPRQRSAAPAHAPTHTSSVWGPPQLPPHTSGPLGSDHDPKGPPQGFITPQEEHTRVAPDGSRSTPPDQGGPFPRGRSFSDVLNNLKKR